MGAEDDQMADEAAMASIPDNPDAAALAMVFVAACANHGIVLSDEVIGATAAVVGQAFYLGKRGGAFNATAAKMFSNAFLKTIYQLKNRLGRMG